MIIQTPAKVNLRLKIEGRRDDGYHYLSMLNIFCDLCDELEIEIKDEPGITLDVEGAPSLNEPKKNFAYIAAEKFLTRFEIGKGLSIKLRKQIPVGSGLGGGSGNAAYVLKTLVRLFGKDLLMQKKCSEKELYAEVLKIGGEIGSDVYFFFSEGAAIIKGIGEKVYDIRAPFLENMTFALILPQESVDTKLVYQDLREQKIEIQIDEELDAFVPITAGLDYSKLLELVENDLQPITGARAPLVAEVLDRMQKLPEYVTAMSGSGSAIFALKREDPDLNDSDMQIIQTQLQGLPLKTRKTTFF